MCVVLNYYRSNQVYVVTIWNQRLFTIEAYQTSFCFKFSIYLKISFPPPLQTPWSPWAWCSSLCLSFARHTHLYMNTCWLPFAGKNYPQLKQLCLSTQRGSWHFPSGHMFDHTLSVLWCLSSLVEDCQQALTDCRNPSLDLEEFLRQRSRELKGKEESEVSWSKRNAIEKFSCFLLDCAFSWDVSCSGIASNIWWRFVSHRKSWYSVNAWGPCVSRGSSQKTMEWIASVSFTLHLSFSFWSLVFPCVML